MATGAKSASTWEYFRLFKSSAAFHFNPEFKMVVHRMLAENESEKVASQAMPCYL